MQAKGGYAGEVTSLWAYEPLTELIDALKEPAQQLLFSMKVG